MKKVNKDNILSLRSEGKSYDDIAHILNCSKGTISRCCGGDELSSRCKKKITGENIEKFKSYLLEHTYAETAAQFKISISAIRKYCTKRTLKKELGIASSPYIQTNFHDTKLVGDISEYAVMLEAMKKGIAVSKPIGDRLSYDMIFDIDGHLFKIQVKTAWRTKNNDLIFSIRKTLTNARIIKTKFYDVDEFDFVITYAPDEQTFCVFKYADISHYKSMIFLKRHQSALNNWDMLKHV